MDGPKCTRLCVEKIRERNKANHEDIFQGFHTFNVFLFILLCWFTALVKDSSTLGILLELKSPFRQLRNCC